MDSLYGGIILIFLFALWWHYFAFTRFPKLKYLGYLFLLFFIFRGLIATLNSFYEILPLQRDAINFHNSAVDIANLLAKGNFKEIFSGLRSMKFIEPGYTVLMGFFYFLLGKSPFIGFVLNTFFFSLTVYNVYRIASLCFNKKSAKIAALLYLCLPYSMLHSTYFYRDPIVNYFLSEFFYRLLLVTKGEKQTLFQWLWIIFVYLYSGVLRRENLVILTAVIGFLLLRRVIKHKGLLKPALIIISIGFIVLSVLFVFQKSESWLLEDFVKLNKVENISARIDAYENQQSGYLVGQQFNSYVDVIKYAPIRAVYFMFSPFPWDIFKKSQYISFAEAMIIAVIIIFLPKALLAIKKQNPAFFYVVTIYLLVGIIGSGLIQSNSAGAQRHRTQFTFLIVAIAMPYMYNTFLSHISLSGKLLPNSLKINNSST